MSQKLGKPDPRGYYVVVASRELIEELPRDPRIVVEEAGKLLFIRTKSRSLALKILRIIENKDSKKPRDNT